MREISIVKAILAAIGCAAAILAGIEFHSFAAGLISLFIAINLGLKLAADLLTIWLDRAESKQAGRPTMPGVQQISIQ